MRSNSRQTGLGAASPVKRVRVRLRGDVKMNSRIPTNASENGGGEIAGHNGELLIANDFLVARLGLGTMRLTGNGIWSEPAHRTHAIPFVSPAPHLALTF